MPCLSVYAEDHPQQPYKVLGLPEHISAELARVGVHYAHCLPEQALGAKPTDAEVLAAYQSCVQPLRELSGYQQLQLVRESVHTQCLDEHSHSGAEVHLFVAGQALIGLHAAGMVYELICEKGDALVIPAGPRHWFDAALTDQVVAAGSLILVTVGNALQFPALREPEACRAVCRN